MPLSRYLTEILVVAIVFVAGCATAPISYEKRITIAVWTLEDLTPGGSFQPDLGEALSVVIMKTVKDTSAHTVIERARLLLALEELNLGTTSLVDESVRLEIGKLLQAHLMIFGGYQVIGGQMRLDLRMVDVGTGRILKAVQQTTPASDYSSWLRAAELATAELL